MYIISYFIVRLVYLGHSEKGTGNWCFKDGTISFLEIFNLFRKNCTKNCLYITTDCSHSGQWVRECAKTLDNLHIPPCGHKARENRALVKVHASFNQNKEAAEPYYCTEELTVEDTRSKTHYPSRNPQQKPTWFDSTKLVCCRGPDSPCPQTTFRHLTWENAVDKCRHIRKLKRKEGDRDIWYYIMLYQAGEDYLEKFHSQCRTNSTLKLSDWGYIIESGEGKNIPGIIQDKVDNWTTVSC